MEAQRVMALTQVLRASVLMLGVLSTAACSQSPTVSEKLKPLGVEQAATVARKSLETPLSQYPENLRPKVDTTAVTQVRPGIYQVILKIEAPLDSPVLVAQNGGKPLQPGQNIFPASRYVLQTSAGEILISSAELGNTLNPDGRPIMPVLSSEAAQSLFMITFGKADAPHRFLLFADVGCPYCHELLARIQPAVAAGKVRVDVVPTAIVSSAQANSVLRPDNLEKAMACMTKPVELPQAHLCGTEGTQDTVKAIQRNTEVFKFQAGLTGVPAPMRQHEGVWELVTREEMLRASQ